MTEANSPLNGPSTAPNPRLDSATGKPRFRGIVPPLVTPLVGIDELDSDGLTRLLEHTITGGVSGLFILGTTGEAPSLSYRLRRELIGRVCDQVAGRVPVLVGITDTSFVEALSIADLAAECGAAAAVMSTPYYFPAGQTELMRYIEHVLDACPLPLMLYNMPSLTKVWFEFESLERLSQHPSVVGVKDSSGDLDYFDRLLTLKTKRPDWSILIGPEHLTQHAVRRGADGGVNGGANLFPQVFSELFALADRVGQLGGEDLRAVEHRLNELQGCIDRLQAIYEVGKYASRFIKATKCGLSLMGIASDFMAEPFNHFMPPERQRVAEILKTVMP